MVPRSRTLTDRGPIPSKDLFLVIVELLRQRISFYIRDLTLESREAALVRHLLLQSVAQQLIQ